MRKQSRYRFLLTIMPWVIGSAAPAFAVDIYGGGTYNSATDTGYTNGGLAWQPGNSAGDGIAVGMASYTNNGTGLGSRPILWTPSGTTGMQILGIDGSSGSAYTKPFAVSENGLYIVGGGNKYVSAVYEGTRAIRWNSAGVATELGNLGVHGEFLNYTTGSEAYAVNNAGTAVGYALKATEFGDNGDRAVRWAAASTVAIELGHLGTDVDSWTAAYAYAINESGTAAGKAYKYVSAVNKGYRATRWESTGTAATELGTIGTDSNGNAETQAFALNASGTVVGWGTKYNEANAWKGERAIRWDGSGTVATELGALGTSSSGMTFAAAWAINDDGTAVGFSRKYDGPYLKGERAVRWISSDTAAEELGNLGTNSGYTNSRALSINSDGIIVGWAAEYTIDGDYVANRAVAWGADGTAIDLNALLDPGSGWINLYEATDISNTGWVSGYGLYDPDGEGGQAAYDRMFLMQFAMPTPTPVPEPASLTCFAGMAVLLLRRCRRQNSP